MHSVNSMALDVCVEVEGIRREPLLGSPNRSPLIRRGGP